LATCQEKEEQVCLIMIALLFLGIPIVVGLASFFYAVYWLQEHDRKEEGIAW